MRSRCISINLNKKRCNNNISKKCINKKYCWVHIKKNPMIEIGICYSCKNPCNILSQICGRCARNGDFSENSQNDFLN